MLEYEVNMIITNYTLEQLEIEFEKLGLKKFSAKQVCEWIYKKNIYDFSKM